MLLLQHPELSQRDCNDCWIHVYNEKTNKREERLGGPVKRPDGTGPPCVHGRCKKGPINGFKALLPHNMLAYEHYKECEAIGHFPDDPIVRRNAKLIRMIENRWADAERRQETLLLTMQRMKM